MPCCALEHAHSPVAGAASKCITCFSGGGTQVKTWTPTGELLATSGHHHSSIHSLMLWPGTDSTAEQYVGSAGGPVAVPGPQRRALWCGCADGTISVWSSESAVETGRIDQSTPRLLGAEAPRKAAAPRGVARWHQACAPGNGEGQALSAR
jgi:hypothetical protein